MVLYENDDSLERLQEVLKLEEANEEEGQEDEEDVSITLKQLSPDGDNR